MTALEIKTSAELQALIFAVNQGSIRCDEIIKDKTSKPEAKAKAHLNNYYLDEIRKRLGQIKM